MSVDCKLFVIAGKENHSLIGNAVLNSLNKHIRIIVKEKAKASGDSIIAFCLKNKDDYSNGISIHAYDFDTYMLRFDLNGEQRMLWFHTDNPFAEEREEISTDYKFVFSIGCWGDYKTYINLVAEAVKPFGTVYVDWNDSDDIGYELINNKGE